MSPSAPAKTLAQSQVQVCVSSRGTQSAFLGPAAWACSLLELQGQTGGQEQHPLVLFPQPDQKYLKSQSAGEAACWEVLLDHGTVAAREALGSQDQHNRGQMTTPNGVFNGSPPLRMAGRP